MSWYFRAAPDGDPVAELHLTPSQAWRLLTNNYDPRRDGATVPSGDDKIIETLLRTRAIIGHVN